MRTVYFDASALVKLVLDEHGTDDAKHLWKEANRIASSELAYTEVRSALASARRERRLTPLTLARAKSEWDEWWAVSDRVPATYELAQAAGEIAELHALRAIDALHLATALSLGEERLIVASWDDRLRHASRLSGLAIAPVRTS